MSDLLDEIIERFPGFVQNDHVSGADLVDFLSERVSERRQLFEVCLTREVSESCVVRVSATDIEQAQEIALAQAADNPDLRFETDDASPGELYCSWAQSPGGGS